MCKTSSSDCEIKVDIKDVVMTPLTCARIINELLKCLLYEKTQIPYPYMWLKNTVSRKRKSADELDKKISFTVEKHYRDAFQAYRTLEDIMSNIVSEFSDSSNVISEVVVLFGTTLFSVKEAFTIKLPSLDRGHIENYHSKDLHGQVSKILREIVFSTEWLSSMETQLGLMNMFVLIKKAVASDASEPTSFFHVNPSYSASSRSKNITISLNYKPDKPSMCCNSLVIFEDENGKSKVDDSQVVKDQTAPVQKHDDYQWFEASSLFKGFKDRFIDKVSISKLW